MRTIDDIPDGDWPSPLPLHPTPLWARILLCRWRFWHDGSWVYLTDTQYRRLFGRN